MLNFKHSTLDIKYWTWNNENLPLIIKYWTLNIEHWTLSRGDLLGSIPHLTLWHFKCFFSTNLKWPKLFYIMMTHGTLSLFIVLGHLEINWLQNNGYAKYWQYHKVRFSYINSFVIFWKPYQNLSVWWKERKTTKKNYTSS